ncbi:MAG: acyl carrier protein [Akkermansia muciniphila]|nr:acyl carrier protein [Akkermansia muciniphila]
MDSVFLSHVKEVLEIEDREIGVDDEFRSYEEWSSLAFLSMIAMIDEEYGVIIDGNTFRTLKTWKDVIAAIQARKG